MSEQPTNGMRWRLERLESDMRGVQDEIRGCQGEIRAQGVLKERIDNLTVRFADHRSFVSEEFKATHEEISGLRRAIVVAAIGLAVTAFGSVGMVYALFA